MISIAQIANLIGMLRSGVAKQLKGDLRPYQTAWAQHYGPDHSGKLTLHVDRVDVRRFNPLTREYMTWILNSDFHMPGKTIYFHESLLTREPTLDY